MKRRMKGNKGVDVSRDERVWCGKVSLQLNWNLSECLLFVLYQLEKYLLNKGAHSNGPC